MHQHLHCRSPIRGRKRERIWENIWRDNSWKLFEHGKGNSEVQEAERVPGRIDPRRNTLRHIVIKLAKIKDKDKIFKATREKWEITYKGTPIRSLADFPTGTLQTGKEWHDVFKMMKGKKLQPRIFYLPRLSFRFDGKNQMLYRQAKIQHHQISFTRYAKGIFLGRKQKKRKEKSNIK